MVTRAMILALTMGLAASADVLRADEPAAGDGNTTARHLIQQGEAAYSSGDLARATALLQQALDHQQRARLRDVTTGDILNDLGLFTALHGDLDVAQAFYERALAILEKEAPTSTSMASTLNNFGELYRNRGDLDRAQSLYERAVALISEPDDTLAVALNNLGIVARTRGD